MATLLTLGIIAALFNALVSGITCYGRFAYSSGPTGSGATPSTMR